MTAAGRSAAPRRSMLFVLAALSGFGPLSLDMYLPALPSMSRDLHTGASQAQLTLTACLVGLALGQLFVGPVSDAVGRRRPLIVGMVGYTVLSAACAISPSVWALLPFRLMQGLAGGAGVVIARAVVRDHFSGTAAARYFALMMLVNGLAPILAPLVGGQLLRVTDWRGVFGVLAGIGVVLLLSVLLALPESLPPARRRTGGLGDSVAAFRLLLADRLLVAYVVSSGLAFAAMFGYISGSSFVLQDSYGVSAQTFSLIFGLNAVGIMIVSQVGRALVARVGPRRLLAAGLCACALGGVALLVVVLAGVGLAGVLPCLFVLVSSIGMIFPNATALALADHGEIAGSASALLGVTQFVIGAVTAPLVGIAGTDTAVPMAVLIAVLSVAALVTFLTRTRTRPAKIVVPPV